MKQYLETEQGMLQFNMLKSMTQTQQIEHILDQPSDPMLIDMYNAIHDSNFYMDLTRYTYSGLKHVTIQQAILMYDSIKESLRDGFIYAIQCDHEHLSMMLDIHASVTGSVFTTHTIQ